MESSPAESTTTTPLTSEADAQSRGEGVAQQKGGRPEEERINREGGR